MLTRQQEREKKLLELKRTKLAFAGMEWQRLRVDMSKARTGPTCTQYSTILLKTLHKSWMQYDVPPHMLGYTTISLNSEALTA
jgi:hypothetical protein